MPDRQAAYLLDILNSANAIGRYLAECDREAFLGDGKTQDAVLRRLMVIGEAAARLTEETCSRFSRLPFRKMPGFETAWFTTTARLISKSCGIPLPRTCPFCGRLFVSSLRKRRPTGQTANRRVDPARLPVLCHYFFSPAVQFVTTVSGGEAAAPGPPVV